MKKTLPASEITNELAGASLFFQKPEVREKSFSPSVTDSSEKSKSLLLTKSQEVVPSSTSSGVNAETIDTHSSKMVQEKSGVKLSRRHDVTSDVMTSLVQDINKRVWRDIIEETETHNSSLRMSVREREQMEDLIRTLKRKYKIKTSMNEIARLGLLFLIHDFMKNADQSVIVEVKKS